MARNLPQEMVDLVVGEFQMDDLVGLRSVAACGLVCREWLPSSRYRLFADVDLDVRTVGSFLDNADKSLFPISSSIRSLGLSFSGDGLGLDECLRRLGPLPLVETLRITMGQNVLDRNSPLLERTFPKISTLVFLNFPLELGSILRVASSFPALESLVLDWVHLSFAIPLPSKLQCPPRWNALRLDLLGGSYLSRDLDSFFEAILSLDKIPVLSSLSVRGTYPQEDSPFAKYLAHVGPALQHLCLESEARPHLESRPVGLRHSTNLRRLDLIFHISSGIAGPSFSVLSNIRSPNLATINIIDKCGSTPRDSTDLEWRQLDAKLADTQFADLQTFTVRSKSQALIARVAEILPSTEERGILRVVVA
ncbi:hypothetical protein DFH06DRAFT_1439181 [Mycena polygramma]|nr:hypothetical protein DFH06DRAFT_1439181 [Mycena polygramma]